MRMDDLREIHFSSSPTQLLDVFAGVALSGLLLAFVLRVDRLTAVYAGVTAAAASWGISWVRSTADRIGCAVSDARVNVPSACRCPLSRPAARRKFVDQAWQLAIHCSCFLWEASLLWRNAEWWTDPNTCFQPCPADVTFGAELRALSCLPARPVDVDRRLLPVAGGAPAGLRGNDLPPRHYRQARPPGRCWPTSSRSDSWCSLSTTPRTFCWT